MNDDQHICDTCKKVLSNIETGAVFSIIQEELYLNICWPCRKKIYDNLTLDYNQVWAVEELIKKLKEDPYILFFINFDKSV